MKAASPWSPEHHYVSSDEIHTLSAQCEAGFAAALSALRVPAELRDNLESFYMPLAVWLERAHTANKHPLVVGVCGGQGSGKSTLCSLLCELLQSAFALRTLSFSIDDIYRTHEERQRLAIEVHPLFATRGVPGTHDVTLGIELLDKLIGQGVGQQTAIPVFDKAADTRSEPQAWREYEGPVDIILFEGWCVGATAQAGAALDDPVNELERDEDVNQVWRRCVNEALKGSYTDLFARLDLLVLLEVDNFERVFAWRQLQEHKLAERLGEEPSEHPPPRTMTDVEVARFIMHYERITRHILAEMPARADLVVHLDASHSAHHTTVRRRFSGRRANRPTGG